MFGINEEIIVFLVIFILFPGALWLWALTDILKNEFTNSNKIVWLLVVFFIPILGFVLYFFIGRKQKQYD